MDTFSHRTRTHSHAKGVWWMQMIPIAHARGCRAHASIFFLTPSVSSSRVSCVMPDLKYHSCSHGGPPLRGWCNVQGSPSASKILSPRRAASAPPRCASQCPDEPSALRREARRSAQTSRQRSAERHASIAPDTLGAPRVASVSQRGPDWGVRRRRAKFFDAGQSLACTRCRGRVGPSAHSPSVLRPTAVHGARRRPPCTSRARAPSAARPCRL